MPDSKTRIIVSGAAGRMGQAILRLASDDPTFEIVGGLENAANCGNSQTIHSAGKKYPLASTMAELNPPPDSVLIEFTTPEATRIHLAEAVSANLKIIVGTTGLTETDQAAIREAAMKLPVLFAANMSAGVNVLLGVVSRLAAALPDYDIEIVEMHHRLKADAPSGTALALGESAAAGRGKKLSEIVRHGREGIVGQRPSGELGMHAVRGGDVAGDHTVIFAGQGERIEVIHRAQSRDTFAAGALRAARFLSAQKPGLYSMKDALGLA